jgi:hypothetical protein
MSTFDNYTSLPFLISISKIAPNEEIPHEIFSNRLQIYDSGLKFY